MAKILKKQPGLVFYRPAVMETLKRGVFAEIQAQIKGARAAKATFGDFDGLIAKLESAAIKAKAKG
jgi:hypothetical protein